MAKKYSITNTADTILDLFSDRLINQYSEIFAKKAIDFSNQAAMNAQRTSAKNSSLEVEIYSPLITAPNRWLPTVESRIRDSVLPNEYMGTPSTEWLSEQSANAAISFLHQGADILPTEPHIYATQAGDFVAEFETPNGRLTSVVSDQETTLFVVLSHSSSPPISAVIRRGSNQFRHELESITKQLNTGLHGTTVESGG